MKKKRKKEKEKNFSYNSMMNLKNYIIKIFRNKIKIYGEKKVN